MQKNYFNLKNPGCYGRIRVYGLSLRLFSISNHGVVCKGQCVILNSENLVVALVVVGDIVTTPQRC